MTVPAEITADRERIKSITSMPEAAGQLPAALAIALAGATIEDARAALNITRSAYTADELAAKINGKSR